MIVAICGFDELDAPWNPVRAIWPEQTGRVYVACCNRLAPVQETETHLLVAYGGYVVAREFRCLPDAGCHVNPGYLRTAHLRSYEEFDDDVDWGLTGENAPST